MQRKICLGRDKDRKGKLTFVKNEKKIIKEMLIGKVKIRKKVLSVKPFLEYHLVTLVIK